MRKQPTPQNGAVTTVEEAAPILADLKDTSLFITQGGVAVGEAFDAGGVIRANIAERALDERWDAARTLDAMQPGYTDPTIVPERQVIPNATRSQLEQQAAALRFRGGTYDIYHAQAIEAFLGGKTSSIIAWPEPGSGSAGRAILAEYPQVFG